MNAAKPLTFAAALLISTAGIAGIRAYANASARSVLPAVISAENIQTLPTITVHPSRAQIEAIHGHAVKGTDSTAVGSTDFDMPYYSFAAKPIVGSR
ncbi:MAG: hypothetical protein ABIY40_01580 [Rhodanobacteraceae bacterium]